MLSGMSLKRGLTGPTPVISMLDVSLFNSRFDGSLCEAIVRIHTNGSVYESDASGTFGAATDTWLDSGSSSDVWVERTIVNGGLNGVSPDGIGAGRVAMTSSRDIGVFADFPDITEAEVTIRFYNAASGGTLLDTVTLLLGAESG